MRQFELRIEGSDDAAIEHVMLDAPAPESVFFWAAHNARGRTVEIFEDGVSRGRIAVDADSGVWVVSGPSDDQAGEPGRSFSHSSLLT